MKINKEDIINYLEGKLVGARKKVFQEKMDESARFKKEMKELESVWKLFNEFRLHKNIDTYANWKKISCRIRKEKIKVSLIRAVRLSAAVLFIPLLISSVILYQYYDYLKSQSVTQVEVTSALGMVSHLTLPDGSEVWLNSGSTLAYPQVFDIGSRKVRLCGEAYFKVNSNTSNRFDVLISDQLNVSAYGTEFNIKADKTDSIIAVTLAKGNVEVKDLKMGNIQHMTPRQQVKFSKSNRVMNISDVHLITETSWKDGKVVFRQTNMLEVAHRLSRHFNVDIRLEGKELYEYKYSATFTTETLSEVLELLIKTAPISYTVTDPLQSYDYSFTQKTVVIKLKEKKK